MAQEGRCDDEGGAVARNIEYFGGTRSNLALFIILISLSKTWKIHAGISAMRAHTQKYKCPCSLL